jgi:hypothetical protein
VDVFNFHRASPFAVAAVLALTLAACTDHTLVHGTVLKPGQSITARNKFGRVRIVYVAPATRRFEFDGQSKTVRMTQRQEMFDGRSGIYDPADRLWPFTSSLRIVCEDSDVNFDTVDQAYAFLYQGSEVEDWVYTPDGLVVGFGRNQARNQINVDLFQILIRGKKPSGLKWARPAAIHLLNDVKA